MKINLKSLSEKELAEFIAELNQPSYRARQIINWIYKKYAISFEEMTDLPKSFRELLKETLFISNLKLLKRQISKDGTQKFLFELEDEEIVESVLISDEDRLTLCISSQVGCAMGCKFCMTGSIGLKRNLKADEIVEQIITVQRMGFRVSNIVFMGMGEPLHNFDEVMEALWRIKRFLGFSMRRVTVSICGIVPRIAELAKKGNGVNLAISLNATNDEIRDKIMPINHRYPLRELLNACKRFSATTRKQITFEYVMLNGINDSKEDAIRLITLLRGIRAKINLIPFNSLSPKENEYEKSSEEKILAFQKILHKGGLRAFIRKSKGSDIFAACGQLKASYLNKS